MNLKRDSSDQIVNLILVNDCSTESNVRGNSSIVC